MVATKLMTIEELEALPPDGRKRELLHGELLQTIRSFQHVACAGAIFGAIGPSIEQRHLGHLLPGGHYLFSRTPDILLVPDVSFVSVDRTPPVDEQDGYITVIPNLVFEVISPSEKERTVHAKVMAYLEMGVSLVVIVHPEREDVTVWDERRTARMLSTGQELTFGDVLPGLTVAVGALFQ